VPEQCRLASEASSNPKALGVQEDGRQGQHAGDEQPFTGLAHTLPAFQADHFACIATPLRPPSPPPVSPASHSADLALSFWLASPGVPWVGSGVQLKRDNIRRLVVLPLYPQFSITTSGSSLRLLEHLFRGSRWLPFRGG